MPAPWNVFAMFLNGLPLGLIWGLVFGFMEGRRTSEVLGAILCASFIVSSGAVKSVGKLLMDNWHISPFWMPAAAGALFFPLLGLSVWGLSQLPPPSPQDESERVRRAPMDSAARARFLSRYGAGIALLVLAYVLTTAIRDFRDNFAAEIWTALGFGRAAAVFTASELPVAVLSLTVLGVIIVVRDNVKALLVIHGVVFAGLLLLGLSTLAFQAGLLPPLAWMILSGAGLYMAYVPFNAMLFDRLIAASGTVGTAGFLIYVADASGYLGSCALLVWRNFGLVDLNWLQVFTASAYGASIIGMILMALSGAYFLRKTAPVKPFGIEPAHHPARP
jgi:MFS family permease